MRHLLTPTEATIPATPLYRLYRMPQPVNEVGIQEPRCPRCNTALRCVIGPHRPEWRCGCK